MTEKQRIWASLAFVGVLIIIGIPLWWKTTEVYRVSLPYDRITGLGVLPLKLTTNITIVANDEIVAAELRDLIEESFKDSEVLVLKTSVKAISDDLKAQIAKVADEADATELVLAHYPEANQHNNILLVQRFRNNDPVWLGIERVLLFRDATAALAIIHALKNRVWQDSALHSARSARSGGSDLARSVRMRPSDAYDVTLSVIHPAPDEMQVEFDARTAMEDYIGSFVDELESLHNFSLKSQWIHLLDLDFQSQTIKDSSPFGRHLAVDVSKLPHLLTPLEKRISSPVTRNPTINLVLYANPCRTAPLHIYESGVRAAGQVDAFISPKWGGVFISNPSYEECKQHLEESEVVAVHTPAVRLVMGTFLTQLRELLGIHEAAADSDCRIEPLSGVVPRRWELDSLIRIRTLEQVVSAKLTLQSISQLLGEISNIVINDVVGASIKSSVNDVESAVELLRRGDLLGAYNKSQSAHLAAEAAFSDPSLLALLYFPDDQKYAVYIPLFLPVMIPVLISLRNVFRWMRGKKSEKEKSE